MPVSAATDQPFSQMARQMSKLLEQMNRGYYSFAPSETWTPNVNLYESDTAYLVCVDLAGVDKDKIDVLVADQRLRLRGTRVVPNCPESIGSDGGRKLKVHLMEIDHGGFSREVELPHDVARERISAVYRDGLLWIELPKK